MTVRVLTSFRRPSENTNPYITQLYGALNATPGLTVATFSWRAALRSRWDVFHVHWAETTWASPNWFRRTGKQLLFALLLAKVWVTRAAVVRTFHNVETHERQGILVRWLLAWLDRATTRYIVLNGFSQVPGGRPASLIPHGHYVDWYGRYQQATKLRGRLATFGLIRPYKGVEDLISAFAGWDDPAVSLAIGGKPADAGTAERVDRLRAADPRVRLTLRFLSEAELVTLVTESELTVFPYLAMHNSGAVLAALSLDRPVLVPRNEVNAALAGEVGSQWVLQFEGPLTAAVLREALASARAIEPGTKPDLSKRDWKAAGELHAEAYRQAVAQVRSG